MFACLVDVELAAKFQDELALETESGETEKLPESLKFFLDNGPFEVLSPQVRSLILALTATKDQRYPRRRRGYHDS